MAVSGQARRVLAAVGMTKDYDVKRFSQMLEKED